MSQIRAKFGMILCLLLVMVTFIPAASSKYVKSYPIDLSLKTVLAQYKIIWTDQTGSNAPAVQTVSNGDIGFSSEGYYLIVAKGGNGDSIVGPDSKTYEGGYGGIVGGIFRLNPANVTFEVALGTAANGTTPGANKTGALTGGSSPSTVDTGGSTAGGAGTMLLIKNDAYNSTSNNSTAVVNKLLLLAGGGGGSGALTQKATGYSSYGFIGGNGGSNFISPTNMTEKELAISNFMEYSGIAGAGQYCGSGGNRTNAVNSYKGTKLTIGLTGGEGGKDDSDNGNKQALGAGGGGGFGGGSAADSFAGGAGGGSSAINTESSITKVEYRSYDASKILEIYKAKMAEIISLDTSTNSSGKKLSDLCVLGSEGYLYQKDNQSLYSDISFVAIYYLGTEAP